jgi:hypothetical protein
MGISGRALKVLNSQLLAGASVLVLASISAPVAVAQETPDIRVCCNGADGSTVWSSRVPSPIIRFDANGAPSNLIFGLEINVSGGTGSYQFIYTDIGVADVLTGVRSLPGQPGNTFSGSWDFPGILFTAAPGYTTFPFGPPRPQSAFYFASNGGAGVRGASYPLFGIGTAGSAGGAGGDITFTLNADTHTSGSRFHGVLIEANGGAGGAGGDGIGLIGSASSGAAGGAGGTADLTFVGDIQTLGSQSFGIWARANGGAGGRGGIGAGGAGSGGGGGIGGAAGTVFLRTSNNDIMTFGNYSHGILAEAVGGGGGASGLGFGFVGHTSAGGAGLNGGSLYLTIGSNIATQGTDSHGIFAQSIGGGGGSAGATGGLVALGNDGGASGNGARVEVTSSGTIFTRGRGSIGIFAQSVGGGGGAGSTSGGLVALGGSGGTGGNGGTVTVTNRGTVITIGADSHGLLAQSIGDGGGYGGDSGGLVALGGDGASGGYGGSVTLNNYGDIFTVGRASYGMFAQSVGGGGGAGGASGGLVALGGGGEEASYGGVVTLYNDGDIRTYGALSVGILAQSVGGAGGRGGSSGGLVALGGSGTIGGHGGAVNVTNEGRIATEGSFATGIYAESIGGGGGSGGDVGGLVAIGGEIEGAALGGGQSRNSFGGNVTVTNLGVISTGAHERADGSFDPSTILGGFGIGSHGIYARSVGGGGGTGGSGGGLVALGGDGAAGGYGGAVSVDNWASIFTFEHLSSGIYAESIGGGGGEGGSSGGLVALGGNANAGSHGGDVVVRNWNGANLLGSGAIRTRGFFSHAIFARSIGGGGGTAGSTGGLVAVAGDVTMGSGGAAGNEQVSLGAYGGFVGVYNGFNLSTTGDFSSAIWAQSIGGGGGFGGDSGGLISLGGNAAISGYGGDVDVRSGGSIVTTGYRSRGIFAESLGGGGGEGGASGGLISLGGDGSRGSYGGSVTVIVRAGDTPGSIITLGADSAAIYARSIGGGGGFGGDSGGLISLAGDSELGGSDSTDAYGGRVRVENAFDIFTLGLGSTGIFAQSTGGGGGSAGASGGLISLGGGGSEGSWGGVVTVSNSGDITTVGSVAVGIFAESIGGGGGSAGDSGGLISLAGDANLGGEGGDHAYGGDVTVTNSGLIRTGGMIDANGNVILSSIMDGIGIASHGIYARSAGGSGGTGGSDGGLVSIGGDGSLASYGGAVTVINDGTIRTYESRSSGIHAESIGGGGGEGGSNGGLIALGGDGSAGAHGGDVTVTVGGTGIDGVIQTFGYRSFGIYARSLGGGGGSGGDTGGVIALAGDVDLGGDDSEDAYGGRVSVTNHFTIFTGGDHASAIYARSIGGGGGSAGDAGGIVNIGGDATAAGFGGTVSVVNTGSLRTVGDGARGIDAQSTGGGGGEGGVSGGLITIGGDGSTGSHGGLVIINNSNDARDGIILTYGRDAAGIYARSLGGGGGNGGDAGGLITLGGDAYLGGDQSRDAYGGTVIVFNSHAIYTYGYGSAGIYAESLGGGGGTAGDAGGIISLGGDGSVGAHGGAVIVSTLGNITTYGDRSAGIRAISTGAGGGDGGVSGGIVSLGGDGSLGGFGGNIAVTAGNFEVSGQIFTSGDHSYGIYARSIGGGGGDGGDSGGIISLGGDGDDGPDECVESGQSTTGSGCENFGGNVVVSNWFDIATFGDSATGIYAQSIGGGGGTAGDSGGIVSLGGDGGTSGYGGNITVTTNGSITTSGFHAEGIHAESIGGGGGEIDDTEYSFQTGEAPDNSGEGGEGGVCGGLYCLGGDGASGGYGGDVLVVTGFSGNNAPTDGVSQIDLNAQGVILTNGDRSSGIFAQSIGGGGGDGGESGGIVSLGGDGGTGSYGGDVTVTNTFMIMTGVELDAEGHVVEASLNDQVGFDSDGIFARSIGGGGGTGGDTGGEIALGGTGDAEGEHGGDITVRNNGSILTGANNSRGIYAESIGGGGGDGGVAGGWYAIGGDGSDGGYGGTVTVLVGIDQAGDWDASRTGSIETFGDWSDAILARSVGGGGGSGGDSYAGILSLSGDGNQLGGGADGAGGDVTVRNAFNLSTAGDDSKGILAESFGGGGGDGGNSYSIAAFLGLGVGGDGGAGAVGGHVIVDNAADITTAGDRSTAIFAQSLGGGGGNGGSASVLTGGIGGSLAVAVGGTGGTGGHGGVVDVTTSGMISTAGLRAQGVFAQSVGGGGGTGGQARAISLAAGEGTTVAASLAIGGNGELSGDGNDVTVHSASNILTQGFQAHGIHAQSVGGGGGSGGDAISVAAAASSSGAAISAPVAIGGRGGAAGDGGDVTVFSTGYIGTGQTTAAPDQGVYLDPEAGLDELASIGILAQSVGGGGGDGGMSVTGSLAAGSGTSVGASLSLGGRGGAGGDGGTVFVSHSNLLVTLDHFSAGILAQSVGGGGGNGGMAVQAGIAVGETAVDTGVSLGGFGAGGGDGRSVSVNTRGWFIITQGAFSSAVVAQSVGGGGGNGGQSLSGSLALGTTPVDMKLSIGGTGGFGGDASTVSINNFSAIGTSGNFSNGLLAQSIGGGGGNAGFSGVFTGSFGTGGGGALAVNLGGDCGPVDPDLEEDEEQPCQGGDSVRGSVADDWIALPQFFARTGFEYDGDVVATHFETVTGVVNSGDIYTDGVVSNGILAQSVGGGGGNGGAAYTGTLSMTRSSASIAVGLGGQGGFGGDGGAVAVSSNGRIETLQAMSNGIMAQSIGGGGGNGGLTLAGSISVSSNRGGAAAITLGGDGGSGGSASAVYVDASGMISTHGFFSNGILAQSLGGGGGNGGLSGNITVSGSSGQSSGGVGISMGGNGVAGGVGGAVDVTMASGMILTEGLSSNAIFAQSLGGGGGNGGASITGGVAVGRGNSGQVGVSLGGIGGSGNAGAMVSVTNGADLHTGGTGSIQINPAIDAEGGFVFDAAGQIDLGVTGLGTSRGHFSNGIFAQSLGGGGGNGGLSLTAALAIGGSSGGGNNSAAVAVSLGGRAATGDDPGYTAATGGNVLVENSGIISTYGSQAAGIFAQSLGGGGGNGGWAGSFSGTVADDYSASVSLAMGGRGGSGNRAGTVHVLNNAAMIYTNGTQSHGIFASSAGGGGGNGGLSLAGAFGATEGLNVSASFGGHGGSGGVGGDVLVDRTGTIITQGDRSSAIFAESRGGGGGNGGLSFAGTLSLSEGHSFNASFGGAGGDGNSAGMVEVISRGSSITTGDESHGIFAQSLGGGGGNGGTAITGGMVRSGDSNSLNFGLSVGGTGGGTNNAGSEVSVVNNGNILTTGTGSHGIFAQSIGGGGGNGGMAVTVALADTTRGTGKNIQAVVSVGGNAGEGSTGGAVTVDQRGGIMTTGNHSIGIFAQSVGGGGGTAGGAASMTFQLARKCPKSGAGIAGQNCADDAGNRNYNGQFNFGGSGGDSNVGGLVFVTSRDFIATAGDLSHGILAQSIGGGGGEGGDAEQGIGAVLPEEFCMEDDALCVPGGLISAGIDTVLERYDSSDANLNRLLGWSFGGSGGVGGDGGLVTVTSSSAITTTGNFALGIVAQSVGGGGGAGGGSGAGTGFSMGGSGASSGAGGVVTVVNRGAIATSGRYSLGILAQSVGGGGGVGSHAGTFLARDQWPDDYEVPEGAGGGSCEGYVCIGGDGGAQGDGGSVTVLNTAQIMTLGSRASAIHAQSVGGGGGSFNFGLLETVEGNSGAYGAGATGYAFAWGGQGGAGGDAGDLVRVTNRGDLYTANEFAHGIMAQSIGGGGGNGGVEADDEEVHYTFEGYMSSVVGQFFDQGTIGGVTLGAGGGIGGAGHKVKVINSAIIDTSGFGSYGIFAQSVGGGGGDAGATLGALNLGALASGDDETSMDGGVVRVITDASSDIRVRRGSSRGIFAQSIGGGGGSGGISTGLFNLGGDAGFAGDGDTVRVSNLGRIYAGGELSRGIQAQSIGGGGGSGITLIAEAYGQDGFVGEGSVGGANGAWGNGGFVRVDNGADAPILMREHGSMGIFAQSVGGGGGDTATGAGRVSVSLGATGIAGGDGGNVRVENCSFIDIAGDHSSGIVAQSVGGGGGVILGTSTSIADVQLGSAGIAGGEGGDVSVDHCGTVYLAGGQSVGILAQSIGGGGGSVFLAEGTSPLAYTLGSGGIGSGGDVSLIQTGDVFAVGDDVYGVVLQSIGGGGGWIDQTFAGTSGGVGIGGAIDFAIDGDIFTIGANSTAIYLQSLGSLGAGNIVGSLSGYVRGGSGTGAGLSIDGGGDNVVTITETGILSAISERAILGTFGNDTIINHGLVAGNIDLGAGINRFENTVGATFIAHDSIILRSPDVTRPTTANTIAAAASSPVDAGVPAASPSVVGKDAQTPVMSALTQSAAEPVVPASIERLPVVAPSNGAPPLIPMSDIFGRGRPLGNTQTGNMIGTAPVLPAGVQAVAVSAAPANLAGQLAEGSAQPVKAATPPVMDELDLTGLTAVASAQVVAATVSPPSHLPSISGLGGEVFADVTAWQDNALSGFELVMSAPLPSTAAALLGDHAAPVSSGTFVNSGLFLMGLSASPMPLDLPSGEAFDNYDLSGGADFNLLYGSEVITTLLIDGDFEQTETGHLVFDIAFGPYASDQIFVTGDARVAGTGEVTLLWLENADAQPLFTTGGVGVYDGLEFEDTAALDYFVTVGPDGVFLNFESDFGALFDGPNGAALGAHMDAALKAGEGQGMGRLLAMLGNMQAADLTFTEAVGVELNPEAHLAPMHTQLSTANTMAENVFNCGSTPGGPADTCAWSRLERSSFDRDASGDGFSVERESVSFAGGFEQSSGGEWSRAFALAFETPRLQVDGGRAVTEGQSLSAGFGVRHTQPDGPAFGASLSGGWSWGDTSRVVSMYDTAVGASEYQTGFLRLDSHLAQQFGGQNGGSFIRPAVNLAATALRHDGLTEVGLDGLGVSVDANTQWLASITPEVTIGQVWQTGEAQTATLSMTMGARFSSRDRLELPIRFVGTDAAAEAAAISTVLDQEVYRMSVQMLVVGSGNVDVNFGYAGEFGQDTAYHRAGLDFRLRF